jgi:uncharacterized membrane protein required for colicin V production
MNIMIDVLGVALIAANVALGLRYGLLRRLLGLGGLYAGIIVAAFAGNSIASWVYGSGHPRSLYADAWTFVVIAAVVTGGIELLGALYHDRLKAILSAMFDRSAAVALGAVVGFFEIAIVCMVGISTGTAQEPNTASPLPGDRATVSDSVRSSIIGGRVNGLVPQLDRVFQPVLPDDLASHLADQAKIDSPKTAGH